MQGIIEIVRKTVVLVLIMELILQLQPGKNYEPYLKMLVGMMITYSLVAGIFGSFGNVGTEWTSDIPIFEWIKTWDLDVADEMTDTEINNESKHLDDVHVQIPKIHIDDIAIERIGNVP